MHIDQVCITNYKSFGTETCTPLASGFNVIVGQNNAGKTALLEGTSLVFQNAPHRSIATVPQRGASINGTSGVTLRWNLKVAELSSLMRHHGILQMRIPAGGYQVSTNQLFRSGSNEIHIQATYEGGSSNPSEAYVIELGKGNSSKSITVRIEDDFSLRHLGNHATTAGPQYAQVLASHLRSKIYAFRPERLNIGVCKAGSSSILRPDASNLPEVLDVLGSSNPAKFNRYNDLVSEVMPQIKRVTVPPSSSTDREIRIWPIDPSTERDDLSFPLADSGTGIGQVLAIIYVALNHADGSVIIIDEPQSFLHPGAVRKLIDILRELGDHQYILTTHSPVVIASADPNRFVMVRNHEGSSITEVLDTQDRVSSQTLLKEVGTRLSDVFGADSILWVEGPTEEICFPLILQKASEVRLRGTVIRAVKNTGDFESTRANHATLTLDVYRKLSVGVGLMPPAIGFVFDRENKTDAAFDDLRRIVEQAGCQLFVLDRRMYENYLISPSAIANVINELDEGNSSLSADQVAGYIEEIKWDKRRAHLKKLRVPQDEPDGWWLQKAHGAYLLDAVFSGLTDSRVRYDKVRDAPSLTRFILDQNPEKLGEVLDVLREALTKHPSALA